MVEPVFAQSFLDKKSSILLKFFIWGVIISVVISFCKFWLLRDYDIQAQLPCNPSSEACFIYACDSSVEECTGDPASDIFYYKIIHRNAQNIPLCDPADESCQALTCPAEEAGCSLTFCNSETEEEGVKCTNPETYRDHNIEVKNGDASSSDERNDSEIE